MKVNAIVGYLIGLATGAVAGFVVARLAATPATPPPVVSVVIDTIATHDTIATRYDTIIIDTIAYAVPVSTVIFDTIVQEVHVGGALTGWHASLDSVSVECPPCPPVMPADVSPWSVGISAGVGLTGVGIAPFVGIALNYNIITL